MKVSSVKHWLKNWLTNDNKTYRRNRKPTLQLQVLECRTVPALLQVSSGIITFVGRTSVNDDVSVSLVNNRYSVTDSADPITLSIMAIEAGWTNNGTDAVSGPSSGISLLNLSLANGADTIGAIAAGSASVGVQGAGSLDVAGLVSSTGFIMISGVTNLTDETGAGILQAPTIDLSSSSEIGTVGKNLIVSGASPTVAAYAGSNGVYLTTMNGVNITASASGTGNVSVINTAGTLNVTSQGIDANGNDSGNISLSSGGPITLNGNIGSSSFPGTMELKANNRSVNGNFYNLDSNGNLLFSSNSGNTWAIQDRLVTGLQAVNGAITPIDWFDNLPDPGLAALARADFTQDQSITREDFIGLLTEVYNSGPTVTAAELTSLQTLVNDRPGANPNSFMPLYVDNLGSKLVDGNPANSYYHDETVYDSPVLGTVTLRNLTANCSTNLLRLLKDKWFLGDDEPLASGPYETPGGVLFPTSTGLPSLHDVAQGDLADCYYLSALGQLALQSPSTIENMFIDNGDGTYTVQFFDNGVPDYVTIDSRLPVTAKAGGTFIYAGYYQYKDDRTYSDSSNVLWVAYAEKAYAQLAEEGWSRAGDGAADSMNAYSSINVGGQLQGTVWEQLTGATSMTKYTNDAATPLASQQSEIENAIAQGQLVGIHTIDSFPSTPTVSNPGFVTDHSYILESYNPITLTFTFLNPYDDYAVNSSHGQRLVTASWEQVEEYVHYVDEVAPPITINPVPSSPN